MKVVFNLSVEDQEIVDLWFDAEQKESGDFYSKASNALANHKPAWKTDNSFMRTLMNEIHSTVIASHGALYDCIRHRPGYFIHNFGVSYASSAGNVCWIKDLRNGTLEVGYSGARHGLNLHRVIPTELLDGAVPVVYETSEKNWKWDETRDDAIARLTGKTVGEWADIPMSARAARLPNNVKAAMRDYIIAL